MKKIDIVRAWKDEDYRLSLTDAERAALPANPAGAIELSDADLGAVAGGTDAPELAYYGESLGMATLGCCSTVISGCGTHYIGGWSFGCCPQTV